MVGLVAFLGLPLWHCGRDISDPAHVVVAHRPGWEAPDSGPLGDLLGERRAMNADDLHVAAAGRILIQPVTQLEISSTDLRGIIVANRDPRYLMPDAVRDIIIETGCYTGLSTR